MNVREGKGRPKKAFPCHSIQKRAFLCRGRPARERPPLGQGNEYVREKMMNGKRKVEERRDKKSFLCSKVCSKVEERRDKKSFLCFLCVVKCVVKWKRGETRSPSCVFCVCNLAFSIQHMALCKHDQLLVSNIPHLPHVPHVLRFLLLICVMVFALKFLYLSRVSGHPGLNVCLLLA